MDGALRYMYLPVILGGGWKSVRLALRIYLRYHMVTCFFSDEMHPVWEYLPWLCCKPLPIGCNNPSAVATEALLILCEENAAYIPLLFLSPAWEKRLSRQERARLETRFVFCGADTAGKLSLLFASPPPDTRRESPAAGVNTVYLTPKGHL